MWSQSAGPWNFKLEGFLNVLLMDTDEYNCTSNVLGSHLLEDGASRGTSPIFRIDFGLNVDSGRTLRKWTDLTL